MMISGFLRDAHALPAESIAAGDQGLDEDELGETLSNFVPMGRLHGLTGGSKRAQGWPPRPGKAGAQQRQQRRSRAAPVCALVTRSYPSSTQEITAWRDSIDS